MMSRCSALFLVLALSAFCCAQAASLEANPIRKIVTLMQDMQKEIEAEGAKEKVFLVSIRYRCLIFSPNPRRGVQPRPP